MTGLVSRCWPEVKPSEQDVRNYRTQREKLLDTTVTSARSGKNQRSGRRDGQVSQVVKEEWDEKQPNSHGN